MATSLLNAELVRVATEATLLARGAGAVGRDMARRRATRYGTQAVAYVVLAHVGGWYGVVTLDARGKVLAAVDTRLRLTALARAIGERAPPEDTAMVVLCPDPCSVGVVAGLLGAEAPPGLWLVDVQALLRRATGLHEAHVARRTLLGWKPPGNHLAQGAAVVLHADVWPHVDAVARRVADVATETEFQGPDMFEVVSRAVCAATAAELAVSGTQLRREYAQRIRAAGQGHLTLMHTHRLHTGVRTVAALAKRALRAHETARLARSQAYTREPGTRLFNYIPGPAWAGDTVPAQAVAARVPARVVQTFRTGEDTTVHEVVPDLAGERALVVFIDAERNEGAPGAPPRMWYRVRADTAP